MASPDRFYNGVASVSAANPLGALPYLDPTTWAVWMDDFVLIPEVSTYWTNTNTNGTLGVASTGGCGVATQTMGGADNDLSQLYHKTATFALTSGKKAIFEVKAKVDKGAGGTIGQQELFFGLTSVQTGTNFFAADGLSMTADNCLGFSSYDGSTNLNAIARVSDVESVQTGAAVYADATWMVLSFYFDGTSVYFYKDDVLVATLTTYPTAALAVCLYLKAGEGAASVLTTDYVLVAVER
jgi:hypothetical protein